MWALINCDKFVRLSPKSQERRKEYCGFIASFPDNNVRDSRSFTCTNCASFQDYIYGISPYLNFLILPSPLISEPQIFIFIIHISSFYGSIQSSILVVSKFCQINLQRDYISSDLSDI